MPRHAYFGRIPSGARYAVSVPVKIDLAYFGGAKIVSVAVASYDAVAFSDDSVLYPICAPVSAARVCARV